MIFLEIYFVFLRSSCLNENLLFKNLAEPEEGEQRTPLHFCLQSYLYAVRARIVLPSMGEALRRERDAAIHHSHFVWLCKRKSGEGYPCSEKANSSGSLPSQLVGNRYIRNDFIFSCWNGGNTAIRFSSAYTHRAFVIYWRIIA